MRAHRRRPRRAGPTACRPACHWQATPAWSRSRAPRRCRRAPGWAAFPAIKSSARAEGGDRPAVRSAAGAWSSRAANKVDDLARRAGMSVSSFHRSFRPAAGTPPGQSHRLLRLQEARRLVGPVAIKSDDVTRIARRSGTPVLVVQPRLPALIRPGARGGCQALRPSDGAADPCAVVVVMDGRGHGLTSRSSCGSSRRRRSGSGR